MKESIVKLKLENDDLEIKIETENAEFKNFNDNKKSLNELIQLTRIENERMKLNLKKNNENNIWCM